MLTNEEMLVNALRKASYNCYRAMDACNLSGLVHELSDVLTNTLWPIAKQRGLGTDWVNTHPIVICYVDKLAELSGQKSDKKLWDAMETVHRKHDEWQQFLLEDNK